MVQDNNSPPENVHNVISGVEKKYKHVSTQAYTQNIGQDKNSPARTI